MRWLPIEDAPRDGTVIAYVFDGSIVSSCVWLADADRPGWWDVRSDELADPAYWMPIRLPRRRPALPSRLRQGGWDEGMAPPLRHAPASSAD